MNESLGNVMMGTNWRSGSVGYSLLIGDRRREVWVEDEGSPREVADRLWRAFVDELNPEQSMADRIQILRGMKEED